MTRSGRRMLTAALRFTSFGTAAWLLAAVAACDGDDAPAEPRLASTASRPASPSTGRPPPPLPFPGFPTVDPSELGRAPARFTHLVPQLSPPIGFRFQNLLYEANHISMRGPRGDDEFYESTGQEIAERWRRSAAGVRRVFALRDALFSQQDHPIDHDPVALMMPPNWVTVAVAELLAGRVLKPVTAPPIDDDAAWAALTTSTDLFGSFPPSDRLFEASTRPRTVLAPERLRVTNARRSVRMLSADAQAMIDAAARGPEAVADAGAERISISDRRYFGERLRREHIILISVENPNRHEMVEEAKGLTVAGRDLPEEAVLLARNAIYRRRLADGPLAVERYDLTRRPERARAIALLEAIIPEHGEAVPGENRLWLWVHGGLDGSGVSGRDATGQIQSFRAEVAEANVDVDRVDYLSKPHVRIGGTYVSAQLDRAARRFAQLDLPLSLGVGSAFLESIFQELEARRARQQDNDRESTTR